MNLDEITFNINVLKDTMLKCEGTIQSNTTMISSIEKEIIILDESKNILSILKNHKMETKKDFILETINTALQDVFEQNVRIDLIASTSLTAGKVNMKYDIVLYQNDIEMARNEKLLGNNGGGVLSFISILFKILVGYIYSNNKFFLFDEAISQVSPEYRPRLAKFLQQFCETYNFTLVLVSQTEDIDEFADTVYLLNGDFEKDGTPLLKIDSVKGKLPEDDYIYARIKNFQSIKDLEFRYKGFVVIRGGNNIGKSASFRSINSLLFNTFDAKAHPRKNTKRGSETIIEFGFKGSVNELISKKILLRFKSNKVIYEFDGETYIGKSLAFEKVKEKVESIGFKYVNLKDTYKNFKGNLKEQTERLAVTTQYDGFYLVGNKSTETEKVFNFLFDSTEVATAIVNANNDLVDANNLLNLKIEEKIVAQEELRRSSIKYDIEIYKYYIESIRIYKINIKVNNDQKIKQDIINNFINNIDSYVTIVLGINNYKTYKSKIFELKNSNVNKQKNIINELINDYTLKNQIFSFIDKDKDLKEFKLKNEITINKINVLNKIFETYDTFNNYVSTSKSLDIYLSDIQKQTNSKNTLENLSTRINTIATLLNDVDVYKYYIEKFMEYFNNVKKMSLMYDNDIDLKVNKINEFLEYYGKVDVIYMENKIIELEQNNAMLVNKREEQKILEEQYNNLSHEFGMEECSCCQGTGYKGIQ